MTQIEKYIWLIGKLKTFSTGLTLQELSDAWNLKMEGESRQNGESLDRQTLKRWRDGIYNAFDISIISKRVNSGRYVYIIENPEKIVGKSVENWILSSATVSNTLNTYKDLSDRIVCDAVPKGIEHLEPILHAMSAGIAVDVACRGAGGSEWTFRAEPYAIRQHKSHWYMLCKINNLDSLVIYSLGQINEVNIRDNDYFAIDATFDAHKYFDSFFGVVVNGNEECQRIIIRAYGNKIDFLRSTPLHTSQKEIAGLDKVYADFEYYLTPTYDLVHSILSMGAMVKVLSPSFLIHEITSSIWQIRKRYESEDDNLGNAILKPSLNGNFAVIEVETANDRQSSICSLSVVIVRDGNIVKKYNRFVKPCPYCYDNEKLEISGITETDFKDAPLFPDVWSRIQEDINGLPIVGYYTVFAESCLMAAFRENDMEVPDLKFYDALKAARVLFDKELSTKKLQTVAGATGSSVTKEKRDSLSIAEEIAAVALQVL